MMMIFLIFMINVDDDNDIILFSLILPHEDDDAQVRYHDNEDNDKCLDNHDDYIYVDNDVYYLVEFDTFS